MKTNEKSDTGNWDLILTPKNKLFSFPWKEIVSYRDLLTMFIRRDVVVVYKQTILGPLWFFIQPILTTAIFLIVFSGIARISTDGVPPILFYSCGIVIWNYFSESLLNTSRTFTDNSAIFGKVYFPRILVPLSKVASGLLKFIIQFGFFVIVLVYFILSGGNVQPSLYVLLVPFLILTLSAIGLAFGIIFSSLTTKYRDLTFLIQFGVQLMMYATPIIYPLSSIPHKLQPLIMLNPVTYIVEAFRFAFLGSGVWSWYGLGYSVTITMILLVAGVFIFNKVEKTFMDTV